MVESCTVFHRHICRELSRFIAAGRLHAKIDKVGGIVETNRPDSKNYQYQVTEPILMLLIQVTSMSEVWLVNPYSWWLYMN